MIILNVYTVHSDKFCHHNHSPRPVKINKKRFKVKLRLRAEENPLEPIPKIYKKVRTAYLRQEGDCVTQNQREEAVAAYQSVKSSIYRNKRKEVPPQLTNRRDLHDQVLFPGMYALLPNKTEATYNRMIDLLTAKANSIGKRLMPKMFQLDFEITMFNTIKNKYPDAQIRGCFFHYTRAIYRKVVDVCLRNGYVSSEGDPQIKILVRRISALPLVPMEQLDNLWLIIESEKPDNNQKVEEFLNYFVETRLDDLTPRFSRYIWNHWNNTDRRTTNDLEGWHYALNKAASRNHPRLFQFTVILRKEHAKIEDDMKLFQRGKQVKRIYNKYIKLEQIICCLEERVTSDPPQMKWIDYLDNISYLIKHNK
ncbi:hypothetical protein QTP88_003730 [Uroleucon formosanum]